MVIIVLLYLLHIKFITMLDIDECSTGVHNCTQNQQCVNRPGNYVCECFCGYELVDGICESKY